MIEISLVITYTPENGAVNVGGPLENRLLCYGLLEMAKEIVANQSKQEAPRILKPVVVPNIAGRS